MKELFRIFVYLFLSFEVFCQSEETESNYDIPVVEGDGGTITTGVEDDVLILTQENFDFQIVNKEIILVEFYAPWCGHCQNLAPEYAKAAKVLKEFDPPVALAKVDATVETQLASRYEVTGYPTLFIFRKGEKVEYDGPRTAMGIVEYMKERSDPNWKPPPTAVITLTAENFSEIVTKSDIILVEFYAPWCGHCKRLAPEYERAAKVLKEFPTPILLAKIDGTAEQHLAEKYEARGWPTMMIFRKGQKYPYEGPRDELGMINYMKEQAKPPSKKITSTKEIENSLGKADCTIVGFFSSEDDPLFANFLNSANSLRGKFNFLHSFSKKHMKQYQLEKPNIVLFQPLIYATEFEPSKYVLHNDEASVTDIKNFINKYNLPLVGERSQRSRWKYENKYPLVVVYYDVDFTFDHRVQTQLVRKEVAKVAKEYQGEITFAVSNENEFEDELGLLNLEDSGEDINAGFFKDAVTRYKMQPVEDFSAEELKAFVEGVLSGNVKRQIKSQPAPKHNAGPVWTVVGSTFDDLVMQNSKNVLIEFYAPWCGHCKKLEPIYKKLGKEFAGDERILIAKMDATVNDIPSEFSVTGFPTIYYVPANNNKKIISYDGDRTLENLIKFVEKQLSGPSSKDEL